MDVIFQFIASFDHVHHNFMFNPLLWIVCFVLKEIMASVPAKITEAKTQAMFTQRRNFPTIFSRAATVINLPRYLVTKFYGEQT